MICQECSKRPATLHFTKIVNGEKTEYHFCDACAREKGDVIPGTPNGFSIHNLLSGLMDFEPGIKTGSPKPSPQLRCEDCGLTYIQFSKIGRFGCRSCYDHFRHKLEPMLKRIHGNTTHTGKVPKRTGGLMQIKREIEKLKVQMHIMIEQEEFEKAAMIRDQIRAIEQRMRES